ncbi:MAG: septum formation protein Maf [Oligoflexales bacterium]|nr:septum formation protein Maf [Oligoflexales bacterium]
MFAGKNNYQLILASTSPRRQSLFKVLGIDFQCLSPDFEEKLEENEHAKPYVMRNARGKANSVAEILRDHIPSAEGKSFLIVAADTVIELDGQVLLKPRCKQEANTMLTNLSAKSHDVHTGYAIVKLNKNGTCELKANEVVTSRVTLKPFSQAAIADYIASGEPMDKAGAYGIQGMGMNLVEGLDGSYPNVMGLPMSEIYRSLLQSVN